MRANILNRRRIAMVRASAGALVLLFVGAVSAAAQTALPTTAPITSQTLFVASAVPVDVTAGNVTEARERGLTQGRIAGYRKVMARVVAREDMDRVPQQNATQIIDLVREFSIADERSSAVRYLANLTVRFDPVAIRRLLRNANIPFTETLSKPLVVVPMMRTDANAPWQLWEDSNPWRAAWSRVPQDLGLVGLIVPEGGAADSAALSTEQAAGKDLAAINAFAQKYNAGGAVIAMATGVGETLEMTLVEVRTDLPSEDQSLIQAPASGQSQEEFLTAAAVSVAGVVQETWKHRNRVTFGGTTQITALVPVADLKEWLTVKKRLSEVPLIDKLDLQAMTRDRAQVTLYYSGAQRQLELAMSQHDLALLQQNGVWMIQARGAASSERVLGKPGAETPATAPPAAPQ
jgi:hypothetical protein